MEPSAAKDELIWLRVEGPFLPHVFDVIESLVFAKVIVPLSFLSSSSSAAADNLGLLSYREKLIFSSARAVPRATRKNKSNRSLYNSNLNRAQTQVSSLYISHAQVPIKDESTEQGFAEQLTVNL